MSTNDCTCTIVDGNTVSDRACPVHPPTDGVIICEGYATALRTELAEARDEIARMKAESERAVAAYEQLLAERKEVGQLYADASADRDKNALFLEEAQKEILALRQREDDSAEYLRGILRKVDEEQNGLAVCSWCALPTNSDAESKAAHQRVCEKSPLVAELKQLRQALEGARAERCCTETGCRRPADFDVDAHNAAIDAALEGA